jgi:hypothetical protein
MSRCALSAPGRRNRTVSRETSLFTSSGGRRIVSRETRLHCAVARKPLHCASISGVNQMRAFAREKTPYAAPPHRRGSHGKAGTWENDASARGTGCPFWRTVPRRLQPHRKAFCSIARAHPATQKDREASAQTPAAPQPRLRRNPRPFRPGRKTAASFALPGAPAALPLDQIAPNPFSAPMGIQSRQTL